MVDLSVIASEPYPSLALIVGGLLSIFVAAYGRRDDSHIDELGTFFAFILGIGLGIMAFFVALDGTLGSFSLLMMIVLAVTLFLKPLKTLPWAGLVGLAAGAVAVFLASPFVPDTVFGVEKWIVLVVIFFVVGAIVHMLFHFVEDVWTIARMVLDWKPVMIVVGLVAVVEGVLLLMDKSIASLI
jgi:hypothetical protein